MRAPGQGLDAGEQLLEREGLSKVIIRTALEAENPVIDAVEGGKDEDVGLDRLLAHFSQDGEAIHFGDHEVEDDDVVDGGLDVDEGLTPVTCGIDRKARFAQTPRDDVLE